jgi:uncharacterized membrane protein HdeD (DUF308 family)
VSLSSSLPSSSGLRLALGVVCLVLGIIALVWPDATLVVLAVLLGLQLILAGIAHVVLGLRISEGPSWLRPLIVVLGGLVILAGILTLFRPGAALVIIVWFVAAGWLIDGISEIVSGLRAGRTGGERFTMIAFGITSVIAAVILFVFPGLSLTLLAQIAGVVLIVLGVVTLVGIILARRRSPVPA